MRILHTADLHIGQILYQYYDRGDEHHHFFEQLKEWLVKYRPDALVVSGDIFDISQPSAASWHFFTRSFVDLRKAAPDTTFIIIAGNHDSASRLQAHSEVWALNDTFIIGTPPPLNKDSTTGWEDQFIIRLNSGFIIALPFILSNRTDSICRLQEIVAKENIDNKPVIIIGHMNISGSDITGHDTEVGNVKPVNLSDLGDGYDYLALGHIHRPQTLGHPEDCFAETISYSSPVIRYSGSALHVSCDETYPHSVSMVEINAHKGDVTIQQLHIDQLRKFYTLPSSDDSFQSEKDIEKSLKKFIKSHDNCYLRFRISSRVSLTSDFNTKIYRILEESGKDIRYNPKIVWEGENKPDGLPSEEIKVEYTVEDFSQMQNPLEFLIEDESILPNFSREKLADLFAEIEDELRSDNI